MSFQFELTKAITSFDMFSSRRAYSRYPALAKTRPPPAPAVQDDEEGLELVPPLHFFEPMSLKSAPEPQIATSDCASGKCQRSMNGAFELSETVDSELANGPVLAFEEFDSLQVEDWETVDSFIDDAVLTAADAVF